MNADQNNFRNRLRTLNTIIYALMGGVILFIIVSLYLWYSNALNPSDPGLDEIFKFIVPVFVFAGYLLGKTLFKIQLRKVAPEQDLLAKFNNFQTGTILQVALLEAPGLLAIIAFMLTGRFLYLGFAILAVFAMFFSRPSVMKVSNELGLTVEERRRFEE